MDNRIFNVNGSGLKTLETTLNLCFDQAGWSGCVSWKVSKEKGMILYWHESEKDTKPFPSKLTASEAAPIVYKWLETESNTIKQDGWDAETDYDGENSKGWRVYCEDWGHVDHSPYAICAIRPVVLWHGK